MGTIQSKIREGYSLKQKPCLKKKRQRGVRPLLDFPEKSQNGRKHSEAQNASIEERFRANLYQTSLSQTGFSQNWESLENEQVFGQSRSSYPASAIGLIQARIEGVIKYSTGSLIGSNIVLTTAQAFFSSRRRAQASEIKFILDYGYAQEEFQAYKIFIPFQYKSVHSDEKVYREKLMIEDYGVIILKTQANIERYGILGFDFNQKIDEKANEVSLYGFNQRKNCVKIDSIHVKAKIKEKFIKFNSLFKFDITGGPIMAIKDNCYTIIGIHNQAKNWDTSEQYALRLNEIMFEQFSLWITQQEQEIDLRDKSLGKEGVKKLIKMEKNSLSSINISRNKLGIDGLKYLTRIEWSKLHHLDIGGNEIKKEGMVHLVKIPMKNLQCLNMWGNSIGSEGVLLLLQADWRQLNNLNLYNNNIGNQGIKHLINANWQDLESINLGKNCINSLAIPSFQYAVWKSIVSLNLWGNQIKNNKTVEEELKKYFTKIKFLYL